tara:strand:- start:325 stop:630 length:306 start_codon:yes stop_codon:yes gene_type:complete
MWNYYKSMERQGEWGNAARGRIYASGYHHGGNYGHAYQTHRCLQQAYSHGQLGSIGMALGVGANPWAQSHGRRTPSAPASQAFQQYTVSNGQLFLGGVPYG